MDRRGRQAQETQIGDLDSEQARRLVALQARSSLRDAVPNDEAVREVRLRFDVDGDERSWLIDDVYIDPYKRG